MRVYVMCVCLLWLYVCCIYVRVCVWGGRERESWNGRECRSPEAPASWDR